MKQRKIESIIEAGINTFVGMVIATILTQGLQGILGYQISIGSNLGLTAFITAAGIARGYLIRRFFANDLHKAVHRFVTRNHLGEE